MLILTSCSYLVTNKFITHLCNKPSTLRLTFIPTAAEVEEGDLSWLKKDRQCLIDVGFKVCDFTFTNKKQSDVNSMLNSTDFLFVSGGNTFYLLDQIKKSGADTLIREYVDQGLIYCGSSAGSIVAGPDIELVKKLDNPMVARTLKNYKGLGLIDVVTLPHWGNDYFKIAYEKMMKSEYKKGQKIILLTDDQYLLVNNNKYTIESV